MDIIHAMNISALDLNLLPAFEALMAERHVSRAARRVGLSQPAMSNALARLRRLFDDPLLVRSGRGMAPSPRALALIPAVRAALAHLREAMESRPHFQPESARRTLTVGASDYVEMAVLAPVVGRLQQAAPGISLKVARPPAIFDPPLAELQSGAMDLALGFFPAPAAESSFHARTLLEENNCCIVRNSHPSIRNRLTLRQFAEAGHVGIFYRGEGPGLIDNLLAARGLRRRLVVATAHFLAAPMIVVSSDLIATVPCRLARRFSRLLPLRIFRLPLDLPRFALRLLWHERTDLEPAQAWLRKFFLDQAQEVGSVARELKT